MAKIVLGSYENEAAAAGAAHALLDKGYPRDSLSLFGNAESIPTLGSAGIQIECDTGDGDASLWERIKAFFSTTGRPDEVLRRHHDEVSRGRVLLVVEDGLVHDGALKNELAQGDSAYWAQQSPGEPPPPAGQMPTPPPL